MTWEQLKQIQEENQKIAEEESTKKIIECPECGWSPLRQSEKNKDLLCPICGWSNRR